MNRPGFSLIETIVGLVVVSIALYLLIAIFINLAPRTARVETIDKKAYLAQEKMEEYMSRDFTQITSRSATAFTNGLSNYSYRIVVTYVATSDLNAAVPLSPFKSVKVQVWGGPVDVLGTVEMTSLAVNL